MTVKKLPAVVLLFVVGGLTAGCQDDTVVNGSSPTSGATSTTSSATSVAPQESSTGSSMSAAAGEAKLTDNGGWIVDGSTVTFVYRNGTRWSVDTGARITDPGSGTYRSDKGTLKISGDSASWQAKGSLRGSTVNTAGAGTVIDGSGIIAIAADGSVVCATDKKLAYVGPDGSKGSANQGGAVFVDGSGKKYSVGKPSANGTMVGRYSVCNPGNRASVDVFSDVLFPYDGDQLTPAGKALVKSAADTIRPEVNGKTVSVVGHTDSQGTPERNMDLGRRRAQAVATELQRQIPGLKVTVSSAGQTQPTAPNSSAAGRAKNRRVVISWAN